jgi:hypothetical protein
MVSSADQLLPSGPLPRRRLGQRWNQVPGMTWRTCGSARPTACHCMASVGARQNVSGCLRERAVHDRPGPTVTLRDNAKRTKSKTPKTTALVSSRIYSLLFHLNKLSSRKWDAGGGLQGTTLRCGIGLSNRPVGTRKAAPAALAT